MKTQIVPTLSLLSTMVLRAPVAIAAAGDTTTNEEAGLRGSSNKTPKGNRALGMGDFGNDWYNSEYYFGVPNLPGRFSFNANNQNTPSSDSLTSEEEAEIREERKHNMKHMTMEEMDEMIPVVAVVESGGGGKKVVSEKELEKSFDSFKHNWPDRTMCVLIVEEEDGEGDEEELTIPENMVEDDLVKIRRVDPDDLEEGGNSGSSEDYFRLCDVDENKIDSVAILVDVKYKMVEQSVEQFYERVEADGQHAEWIEGEKWNFVESVNSMIMATPEPTPSPTISPVPTSSPVAPTPPGPPPIPAAASGPTPSAAGGDGLMNGVTQPTLGFVIVNLTPLAGEGQP